MSGLTRGVRAERIAEGFGERHKGKTEDELRCAGTEWEHTNSAIAVLGTDESATDGQSEDHWAIHGGLIYYWRPPRRIWSNY